MFRANLDRKSERLQLSRRSANGRNAVIGLGWTVSNGHNLLKTNVLMNILQNGTNFGKM